MFYCFFTRINIMSRPLKERKVALPPVFSGFKPIGIPSSSLETIIMSLDEFEAINLADYRGLEHADAAKLMNISRSTFSRLVEKARHKIALVIIEGKNLSFQGGNIHFKKNIMICNDCGNRFIAEIGIDVKRCPECNSSDVVDLAKTFGHGKCCRHS